jgi:uncharacterized protein YkwD
MGARVPSVSEDGTLRTPALLVAMAASFTLAAACPALAEEITIGVDTGTVAETVDEVTQTASPDASASGSGCAGADTVPGSLRAAKRATLCLLNRERAARGLRPVHLNHRLSVAAKRHSRDMVQRRYFDHTSPSGSTFTARVSRAGYHFSSLGENIAWGSGSYATPRSIMRSWMNSPGHRANILRSKFREIGIGIVAGTPVGISGGAVYTTEFGRR